MKRTFILCGISCSLLLGSLGCEGESSLPRAASSPTATANVAEARKVPAGRNVTIEIQGDHRRVLVNAVVCLREGMLEQLLCRRHTKEHEAILTADVDAREIHRALLVTGAKPGTPVVYEPRYQAATGSPIRVTVQYEKHGKLITVPAQHWIRNMKTRKDLDNQWVFAGSRLFTDEDDKTRPPFYAANSGDVICVSNFEDAMLDLPITSPKDNDVLNYEAHTERIPPLETKVVVILEPIKN